MNVIRQAHLFVDGTLSDLSDIVIDDGGIIASIRPPSTEIRQDDYNGKGGTLLPGFIDAHVHVFPGDTAQALSYGVTTELDMFSDPNVATTLRAQAQSDASIADLRSAGTAATVAGGHPTQLVARGYYPPFPVIEDATDPETFVKERVREGADYIKIILDDGLETGHRLPTLSAEMCKALVSAAHTQHRLTVAHASTLAMVERALEAGADILTHVPLDAEMSDEVVQTIAKRCKAVIPTLTAMESTCGGNGGAQLAASDFAVHVRPQGRQLLAMSFPHSPAAHADYSIAKTNVAKLHKAGTTLLAGTDAGTLGTAHGISLHRELELLVEAGLSESEALEAATLLPARVFALHDRGSIKLGMRADLLLVRENPLANVHATRSILAVWRTGILNARMQS